MGSSARPFQACYQCEAFARLQHLKKLMKVSLPGIACRVFPMGTLWYNQIFFHRFLHMCALWLILLWISSYLCRILLLEAWFGGSAWSPKMACIFLSVLLPYSYNADTLLPLLFYVLSHFARWNWRVVIESSWLEAMRHPYEQSKRSINAWILGPAL